MSDEALNIIASAMAEIGLNYEFMEWTDKPSYPYFTGEYIETEPISEDGLRESKFILTGFARHLPEQNNPYVVLERAKGRISRYFDSITGKKVITDSGSVVAIFYADAFPVRTADAELKKIQINLDVKEWRVN